MGIYFSGKISGDQYTQNISNICEIRHDFLKVCPPIVLFPPAPLLIIIDRSQQRIESNRSALADHPTREHEVFRVHVCWLAPSTTPVQCKQPRQQMGRMRDYMTGANWPASLDLPGCLAV